MFLELNEVKRHLNIDDYYTLDDGYISSLIESCTAIMEEETGRKASELEGSALGTARQAVLLLVGDYFATRESAVVGASVAERPMGFIRLCRLIRNYAK